MSNKKTAERDEVEDLLRAAEDEMLLKFSVDSHMSRVSPTYIDPDLQLRFQALKKPPPSSSKAPTKVVPKPKLPEKSPETPITKMEKKAKERDALYDEASQGNDELKRVLGDDLFARFTALKGSLPSSSLPPKTSDGCGQFDQPNGNGDVGDDEDDEVEKVIRWAIDAARLDPSSSTDDEDDGDGTDEEEEEDDDDGDRVEGKKKGKGK